MDDNSPESRDGKTRGFSIITIIKSVILLPISILMAMTGASPGKKTKEQRDEFEGFHIPDIGPVLEKEMGKRKSRRGQAAEEFEATLNTEKLSASQSAYKDALASEGRKPIGLAFSGGGIRSATFNLGLVQGLSRYRMLPWVDYVSSVSGGGFTAGCMTSLLSMDKKSVSSTGKTTSSEYFYFNTQWENFPFNPELKVFDNDDVAEDGDPRGDHVGPPLQKGVNRQLEYLRNMGNYLIPQSGWLSRDFLRGLGAVLVRTSYTLILFLLAILAFSAIQYGVSAGLTPSLTENIALGDINTRGEEINFAYLMLGDFTKGMVAVGDTDAYPATRNLYLYTATTGIVFSILVGSFLALIYRKDPTRKYRLERWKSPKEGVSLENFLVINNLRLTSIFFSIILFVLTIWLWVSEFDQWPTSLSDFTDFYWAWSPLVAILVLSSLWLTTRKFNDYDWMERGMEIQSRIDTLTIHSVSMLAVWALVLLISFLKFRYSSIIELQIFWLWLPLAFLLGVILGSTAFRLLPIRIRIRKDATKPYAPQKLPFFTQQYFNVIGIKKNDDYMERKPRRSEEYKTIIWSSTEFRSIFWSLQGLALFGMLFFSVFSIILLPHYFSAAKESDAATTVPLATTLISAAWATIISNAMGKEDSQAKNLLTKLITLPSGIRSAILSLLVITLSLSVVFLIQSAIDNINVGQAYAIALAAMGLLWIFGWLFDFNYLSQHYFFRDRIADTALKTEVKTSDGHTTTVRDDREERLYWITPENCSAPYHLVMTSLNLPGSWHLKYRNQKAVPFLFSKWYSGSKITGYAKNNPGGYMGGATKYIRALGLSGAAISPGMGYRTFFAQAFMTTLLNVRLGLWMTSPDQYEPEKLRKRPKSHRNLGRIFWPSYLWDELRGAISERKPLVYLTDGEHTGDNIGLYPLFQRRCKVIIAGDAGQDPQGMCKALFRVIRQVKYEFGIIVDIDVDALAPAKFDAKKDEADPSLSHFAVGKIHYPETTDSQGRSTLAETGWLIYFKPSVTRDDPSSLLKYWDDQKTAFPHPTTADQFYDEQQFEMQRALGEWTVKYTLLKLKKHYSEVIKKEKEKTGPGARERRKLISTYETRVNFLEKLSGEEGALDINILLNNPGIITAMLEDLYSISNTEGNKFRQGG